jgi:cardiolipin synthase A/B
MCFLFLGCAKVLAVRETPKIILGEETFFPTMEAHTYAPLVTGNRVDVLLNGVKTFPSMLHDIQSAKSTITFAQYLYEDGSIARQLALAFAERCRAGVKAHILLDSHGSGKAPADLIATMKDAGVMLNIFVRSTRQELFSRGKSCDTITEATRRILVIDGRIDFTGGYGISEA